ncbi:hypothetical protein AVEN_125339-1 [Araneus ventricosus]|uniref:Uncharacterized protein n=1 Tax=Araneus ventricosus TaxID=182803 RepID=A0A4Y2IF68_ARAVE|nr:hypothetical protein AVEN_125339-1 [Araneus ventricosus]
MSNLNFLNNARDLRLHRKEMYMIIFGKLRATSTSDTEQSQRNPATTGIQRPPEFQRTKDYWNPAKSRTPTKHFGIASNSASDPYCFEFQRSEFPSQSLRSTHQRVPRSWLRIMPHHSRSCVSCHE